MPLHFLVESLYVHLIMIELNNGQAPSLPVHPKPSRHNAKHCPLAIRERIVNALANGDSQRAIARNLHVSPNTVSVVAQQEWTRVEARKGRIAAQAELNATLAAERITSELQSKKHIPLNVLVPVFGVNVDKLLSLRGENTFTLRHEHTHRITDDDILAFAVARAQKSAKARVVEARALPKTRALAEKTPRKKPV